MRRAGWLVVIASLTACGTDAQKDAPASSSAVASPTASSSARASSSVAPETPEKQRRELEERADGDAPDAPPTGAPRSLEDADLDALLAGGAALSALPVRSHDRGESFDRDLPERLKPPPGRSSRPAPKCSPSDPLCME